MGLAMEHLRVRDVRGLSDACARPEGLRKLRAFLKGVYVLPFGSNRKVAIRDIELRAGRFTFDKGGRETTVSVCALIHRGVCPSNIIFRNITRTITAVR